MTIILLGMSVMRVGWEKHFGIGCMVRERVVIRGDSP